VVAKSKG